MKSALTRSFAIGLLLSAAACAKNEEELPPPPPPQQPTATPTPAPTPTPTPVRDTVVPGSEEDFMRQVGSDRVFFAFDSSSLDAEAQDTLRRQAEWLKQYTNVTVTIEGHADERGTREYNLALGERRANAAATYLQQQGVAPSRISTISYGKERPAVEGSTEAAYAQNRRAVTVLSGAAAS
ncbi:MULTISPECIES: peptidoglycan-associated lipoprotein Pal [Pacificimonas]|nr:MULTISPECIES: peptidoglycan-associated lipoprotein Pal [Pacificimonas]MBZ6378930.1 peptidoglycan-associated lipoprotein Pal [Pacificimonas aurantium]